MVTPEIPFLILRCLKHGWGDTRNSRVILLLTGSNAKILCSAVSHALPLLPPIVLWANCLALRLQGSVEEEAPHPQL